MLKKVIINFLISLRYLRFKYGLSKRIEKIVIDESEEISGYYLAVKPKTQNIIGVLFLLAYYQPPEEVFHETLLHKKAYHKGFLSVTYSQGKKLFADETVVEKLNLVFNDVMNRYAVKPDKFVIGGFSAGATVILRYAQLCNQYPNKHQIRPRGVFAIDGPVDIIDLWKYLDREITKNFSVAGTEEAKYLYQRMSEDYGLLQTNIEIFKELTPFYKDLEGPGNEQFLNDIHIRIYHDIDVIWYLFNKRRSLYDTHTLNSSEMINRLLLNGHKNAQFIQSKKKGYKFGGLRHPHSWSIVDSSECIRWARKIIV